MDGEIGVESEYGAGSRFSFYVMQRFETFHPIPKLPADNRRRAAVWHSNETKAHILKDKIAKMGAKCDIIEDAENIGQYTHVFFDSVYFYEITEKPRPARLITVECGRIDSEKVPPNMEILKTPLTCLLLYRILGGDADDVAESGAFGGEFAVRLDNARLLVVDDIEINLMIAAEVLREYGGEVDSAKSGAEALEMIRENEYDIVFMDHMMPEMDGVDVTRVIRAMPGEKYRLLPVIALTANVVGDVRDLFIESGMNDFLSKPLDHTEIERVFREWLPKEKWQAVPR